MRRRERSWQTFQARQQPPILPAAVTSPISMRLSRAKRLDKANTEILRYGVPYTVIGHNTMPHKEPRLHAMSETQAWPRLGPERVRVFPDKASAESKADALARIFSRVEVLTGGGGHVVMADDCPYLTNGRVLLKQLMTLRRGPWAGGKYATDPLPLTIYAFGTVGQEPCLLVSEASSIDNHDRAEARREAESLGLASIINWDAPTLTTGRLPRGQAFRRIIPSIDTASITQ